MKSVLIILALTAATSLAACQSTDANNTDSSNSDHWTMPWEHHVDATTPATPNLQHNTGTAMADASK